MKQLIAILIAVLLPLQFAWGMAAAYCQHETTQGAQHFGHHAHVHADAKHDAKAAGAKLIGDIDCGFCHTSPAALLPDVAAVQPASTLASTSPVSGDLKRTSAPQRTPDRPQWLRLA